MSLPHHALQYQKCLKQELRTFLVQRQNLPGCGYRNRSKKDLVKLLHLLDQNTTFRLFDLPPELRELCFESAVAFASDFRRLLLVSKQVHSEAKLLFYKNATFNIAFIDPECHTRMSGNPAFGMCTQYWDHINVHVNPSRIRLAEAFYSQHHVFQNIRHLSLTGGIMIETTSHGANRRQIQVGGSRLLFLTCEFYAFSDLDTRLKTLRYDVEDDKTLSVFDADNLLMTFWPLKLLAGRVRVTIPALPDELAGRIKLYESDVHSEVIEACQRFAQCYFFHNRPSVEKFGPLESTRRTILRKKMAELKAFDVPIVPDNIQSLVEPLKRMEWMDAEQLDHAEDYRSWSLTRAWMSRNGSPAQQV